LILSSLENQNFLSLNLDQFFHAGQDDLERSLTEIATSYNLKKSTLARIIVQQNLQNYTKHKLWFQ